MILLVGLNYEARYENGLNTRMGVERVGLGLNKHLSYSEFSIPQKNTH